MAGIDEQDDLLADMTLEMVNALEGLVDAAHELKVVNDLKEVLNRRARLEVLDDGYRTGAIQKNGKARTSIRSASQKLEGFISVFVRTQKREMARVG